MTFGEKIQRLRKRNGLSQEQLAAKLNVSRQAISKWEMGAVFPVLLLSVVWAISKIVNFPIARQDFTSGNFYTGFSGFVEHFHLLGLVYCCITVWIASIVALAVRQLYIYPVKRGRKFLCSYLIRFTLIIVGTVLWIYGFLNPWKIY